MCNLPVGTVVEGGSSESLDILFFRFSFFWLTTNGLIFFQLISIESFLLLYFLKREDREGEIFRDSCITLVFFLAQGGECSNIRQ